jgi:superfamily I DNA and/or RNA helicase
MNTVLRDKNSYFQDAYIQSCNVVGVSCTENPRTLADAHFSHFDVAIVDEVSKATPPEIIIPLALARTGILVGDHRQLPPLFKEKGMSFEEMVAEQEEQETAENAPQENILTEENYKKFEKMVTASLFKEHFENAPQQLKSMLFTQYRMHPDIMAVINRFYDGRLQCGLTNPDEQRNHGLTIKNRGNDNFLLPKHHAVWLDSSITPNGQDCYEINAGTGKINCLEAVLIAKMLGEMELAYRKQGFGHTKPKRRIAVISFYGKQIKEIRNAVNKIKNNIPFTAIQVDINTVDRFQGQERPIIFVSLVRNPRWKLSKRANTAQFERINVAFSRAQELLVIVGASKTFIQHPVELPNMDKPGTYSVDVYRHIIDEMKRNGCYHTSDKLLANDEWKSNEPHNANQLPKRHFHK